MPAGEFFKNCRECKACCRSASGFVRIYVCRHEKALIGLLRANGMDEDCITVSPSASCRFLGDDGCTLGDMKPFQCRLYPLLMLSDGSLGLDASCTHSGGYVSLLADHSSDAWRHLEAMKREAAILTDKDRRLLSEWSRYVCDIVKLY